MQKELRFDIGSMVMCNLGQDGWALGRVVAVHYREEHWPAEQVAPYQVALECDDSLIYVPEESASYCREATRVDLNIERRLDALAPGDVEDPDPRRHDGLASSRSGSAAVEHRVSGYRDGRCHGCGCCPEHWSSVELYSEHYRAAARNGLKITRRTADLGTIIAGTSVYHRPR